MSSSVVKVSQLNRYVKSLLDGDLKLRNIFVIGEISNFKVNSFSGHIYFTLKDDEAAVKAVIFKSNAQRLRFLPQEGMRVICLGSVTVYERDGAYQLYVSDIQPDGAGSIAIAFEQLKEKLRNEGLFDEKRKKTIPNFPQRIAVITSNTGAAVHDILNIIGRRWPIAKIDLYPVKVQGEGSAEQMIKALKYINANSKSDVVIIGRGGGSAEDLWCFNDENLARTIASFNIPIISAIGHETDFTICDFVADKRAPTPSAAAELAVPGINEVHFKISDFTKRMYLSVKKKLDDYENRLNLLTSTRVILDKNILFDKNILHLDNLTTRLNRSFDIESHKYNLRLSNLISKLDALNPAKTLLRGYCIARTEDKSIKSVSQLNTRDNIKLLFSDGTADCTVKNIERNDNI